MSLRNIDVTSKMEKKGKFSYLSWSFAVDKLIELHPDATWEVKRFPMMVWYTEDTVEVDVSDGDDYKRGHRDIKNLVASDLKVPYMRTDTGYYVEVEVTVEGISRSQVHPVLGNTNKPIDKPNAFEINTSIQRCLAKAIALHGLGLHIYAGEDLPPKEQISPEKVDMRKVRDSVNFFKAAINQDDPDVTAMSVRDEWSKLNGDERMEVHSLLGDKAPDSNKSYKNLLKVHLVHEGEE